MKTKFNSIKLRYHEITELYSILMCYIIYDIVTISTKITRDAWIVFCINVYIYIISNVVARTNENTRYTRIKLCVNVLSSVSFILKFIYSLSNHNFRNLVKKLTHVKKMILVVIVNLIERRQIENVLHQGFQDWN